MHLQSLKVSIITVCLNSVKTIEETILSVISQSYSNLEYIIIDGGSTDGTLDLIEIYKKNINLFICEKDEGIYDAMNKGIKLSTGDIVCILNSDDKFLDKNVINDVANSFIQENVDCIYSNIVVGSFNERKSWIVGKLPVCGFSRGWYPPHPGIFFTRRVYESFGLYNTDLKISADFELILRMLSVHKIKNYYLDKFTVEMRPGGESRRKIKNIIIGNFNVLRAFHLNKIRINFVLYVLYRFIRIIKR